ncbi:MAG: FAD-dependent oxidoreductase, partial [archaeon]
MADKEKICCYDVLILGAGPAGLSAAIYAGRYGLKALVIGKIIGGMPSTYGKIDNYPGFEGNAYDLMKKMHQQAGKFGAEFIDDEIKIIYQDKKNFIVETNKKKIQGKTVIVALGLERNKLSIPGEKKFTGKGVSYCATCDGLFFKDKTTAVIGGANSACEAALMLLEYSKKVYIIYRKDKLRADQILIDKINKSKKIEVLFNSLPIEIKGKEMVDSLVIKQNNKNKTLRLEGVFIEIGSSPLNIITHSLGLKADENNYIIADDSMQTSLKGVFAAGDVIKSKMKQVV